MFEKTTHILLVDDMKGVRILVARLLKQLGYENITEAAEGHEAYANLEHAFGANNPVGLVLCDMRMPGIDGLQLLKKMKENPNFDKIPFIMLTAESDKEAIVNAIRSGVDDYIIKPASQSGLEQKMRKVFDRAANKQSL